ncbi:Glycosyl transferase family 2 [Rubripirellula tenax]|uniref:Glycosyl transferase family 2 n=1 Tax=Rubripirellula tenax TaxID=2528015 RepID=A0A5C6EES8_9BACT|nr:glycosyltransferase family 2 protein [Rubripirellula tenax]TWU47522.1 Glycosyl transferase family 2 [Rubripirellula tenax]
MKIEEVTPLILSFNESPNIRDTLSRLSWASRVVVVDSFSSDKTLEILSQFPNVQVYQRRFDHFADQCNYGLEKIKTPWVLSLDADYKCPAGLASELEGLDGTKHGYFAGFKYCIFGKALRATLYPPRTILYRKASAKYERDGHAHKVTISGEKGRLGSVLLHDDRKSLAVWCASQVRYANDEAKKLAGTAKQDLGWKDRLRLWYVVAPILTLFYCLFYKALILDGWRGIYYSLQRVFAELILGLVLLDRKLRAESGDNQEFIDETGENN